MSLHHVHQSISDVGFRLMSSGHRAILRLSHGRVLRTAFGMPVVELRTVGRTTGQTRTTMLTAPLHDASRIVLVASKGGGERDPQWYSNLKAHPEVEILIEGEVRKLQGPHRIGERACRAVAAHRPGLQRL